MTILITGTSRGIGHYLTRSLLADGNTVIGFSRTEPAEKIEGAYTHYCVDISDEKQVAQAVNAVRKKYGYLDVLINNAGIAAMNHFCLTPLETARRVMNVNFFGTFLMTRECAKLLRKSTNARIVNFSTVAVPLNLAGLPGMSIPCGYSSQGMPIGLQIIGKALDEETIIRAAYTYEQSQNYHNEMAKLGGNN